MTTKSTFDVYILLDSAIDLFYIHLKAIQQNILAANSDHASVSI